MTCWFCATDEFTTERKKFDGFSIDPARKYYPAELDVEFDGCHDCGGGTKSIIIHYCPMCGRGLNADV